VRLAALSILVASAVSAAGCGSADPAPSSVSEPASSGSGKFTVAALGDSITSGSPGYDPDPAQRAALGFGADERSQYEYWAARADAALEFRNCGVFGERTDEIASRLETCSEGADVLIVQGGINDIAQGAPVDRAAANLRSIVVDGKRLGLDVYIVDVLPWNNGHPAADRPIAELNRKIDQIGRDQGVAVIGFHDALENPREAGVMPAELTADGDHPSVAGYRILGELVARTLASDAPG
jgi:lysophospholipase L1-like esterase